MSSIFFELQLHACGLEPKKKKYMLARIIIRCSCRLSRVYGTPSATKTLFHRLSIFDPIIDLKIDRLSI